MMGVDHVCTGERREERWCKGLSGMAMDPGERAQACDAQAARLASARGGFAKSDELSVHVRSERPRQLQRVSLAAPE